MQSPGDEGVNAAEQSKARGFYKLVTDGDTLKPTSCMIRWLILAICQWNCSSHV